MTKEVMVTLSGLQLGDSGEDTVETVHIGEYYEKNGVHYLFFDELLEGHKTPIRNMLKLRNEKLEVRKRGPVSAELVFEEGEVTESAYNIPYGSFLVGVHTKGVCLGVEEEKIEINVTAANTTAIIGKRGAMLDAIQTIAGAVANTGREEYKRVVVDCENYRENREATLQRLAAKLAQKAVRFQTATRPFSY